MISLGIKSIPVQLSTGLYKVPVCSKKVWEMLSMCETDKEYTDICGVLLDGAPLAIYDCKLLVAAYTESVNRICEETGIVIPYYKSDSDDKGIKYTIYTQFDKLAADYANMSIYEIDDISIIDYRLMIRDAFISKLSQTEKGREYLNNAYRLTQTEADEELG